MQREIDFVLHISEGLKICGKQLFKHQEEALIMQNSAKNTLGVQHETVTGRGETC